MVNRIVRLSFVLCCVGFGVTSLAAQTRPDRLQPGGEVAADVTDTVLTRDLDTAFRNLFCERALVIGQTFGGNETFASQQKRTLPPLPALCSPGVLFTIACFNGSCVANSLSDCQLLANGCSGAGGAGGSGPAPVGFPAPALPGTICWATGCTGNFP
jgi:hypothetical protein